MAIVFTTEKRKSIAKADIQTAYTGWLVSY